MTTIASAAVNTAFRSVALAPTAGGPPTGIGNANPNTLNIGDTTLLTVATTQGNPASAITSVTVDLSAFGGSATQTLYDNGTNGDGTASDGTWSLNFTIPNGTTGGSKTVNATIKDAANRTSALVPINFTVNAPTAISATGAANPSGTATGSNVLLSVTVTPGTNPTSSALVVTADLSSIGGLNNQVFYDDGTNGDATSGDNVFSFNAAIPANNSFAGAKTITANISDAQLRTATATISLTVGASLSIMEIQGHGGRSSYAGSGATLGTTYVTTPSAGHTNVVTAVGTKGFFMQDITGDGDPTTSDGVFVFTSTAPTVAVGDYVSVTGRVQEFNGSTEIAGTPSVTSISSGHALPTPYDLSANLPTTSSSTGICMGAGSTINPATDGYQASNFACLDGMYIAISNGLVAAPGNGSGGDGIKPDTIPKGFYATAGNPRGFREPGLAFDDTHIGGPTTGTGNPIYSGPVFDGNPEEFQVFMTGLNAAFPYTNYLYNAGQRFSLTGVIQGFVPSGSTTITYETYPITLTTGTAPTYPVAVATSAPGKLTVGSQNGLHFFNNTADGADTTQYTDSCAGTGLNDTCPTLAQYQARLNKMSLQIRTVLMAPVVQVMQEVENYSVATDIANKLHADDASLTYTPYLLQGNDPGGINLAILVRAGVAVNSVTQIYKNSMTTACSGSPPCLLNDRPPVLLDATYQGYHFRVLAIYDRSLLNLGVAGKDYVGQKRREQAEQVATIVRALQTTGATLSGAGNAQQASDGTVTSGAFDLTGDSTVPVVVVGDFNAYEFTDGYVDVTGTIMGTVNTSQSYSIYPPTASYVAPNPTLFDTGAAANPADHYSYTFNGYAQEIDHILLTQRGQLDFIAISNAHGNAEVSSSSTDVTDGSTARRVSDHDGQVVTLGYVVSPSTDANSAISASTMQTVSKNAQPAFTVTPAVGYVATVSGTCGTSGQSSGASAFTYTVNAVTADCTVVVTSALATYTLTYDTDGNGQVDGNATETQTVSYGNSGTAVSATPIPGYHFVQWSDTRTDNPRTDTNVTGNVSVTAQFAITTYTVNGAASPAGGATGPHAADPGSVDQAPQTINYGGTATFTFTAQTGYRIVDAYDNCGPSGTSSGSYAGGSSYTTGAITGNCTVSGRFYNDSYYVTAQVSGSGGAIHHLPSNVTTLTLPVTSFSSQTFTAVPNSGYSLASVSGCGATATGNVVTTGTITGNCTLTLTFSANPVNGTCGSDNGQTLLSTPTNLCSAGTATTVLGSGHPWTWTCSGANSGTDSPQCSATIKTWTVGTSGSGAGGTISPPASSSVDNGASTTFTVAPTSGWTIASVVGSGCTPTVQSGSTYTTGAVTAACSITATFTQNPINGVCGSDNGRTLSATPTNLCSAGNASVVSGSGPWSWSCNGIAGGTTASCSANAMTATLQLSGSNIGIGNGANTPNAANGTDFGATNVGAPVTHSFKISNSAPVSPAGIGRLVAMAVGGAAPQAVGDLVITGISSSNPAFTVAGGVGTIAQGGSTTFTVTFNPSAVGAQNGTITILSNAQGAASFAFAVTGNAAAAAVVPSVPAPMLGAKLLALLAALLALVGYGALRGMRRS